MIDLDIKFDESKLIKKLDLVTAKEIPFALSKSINETTRRIQKIAIQLIKKNLQNRSEWYLPSRRVGIKQKMSNKNRLTSMVYSRATFLNYQESGGIKVPYQAGSFAVPFSGVKKKILTKSGRVKKSMTPKNLKKSFVIKSKKSGREVIFRREKAGKQSKLIPYYHVQDKVEVPKSLDVEKKSKQVVDMYFYKSFKDNFDKITILDY
jgi:hypothetical protein